MTVKELIEELQKLPENDGIWIESTVGEYNPSEPMGIVIEEWGRDFGVRQGEPIKYRHKGWVIR